jgi:NitT/TauT family transport system ATP-binding protein
VRRVAAHLTVDLPADRDLDAKRLPEFLALRARVEDQVRAFHHAA